MIRSAGDTLQQQFGPAAVEILYEALDDAQEEMDSFFGDEHEPIDEPGSTPGAG
jgi:hypothetical protein